MDNYTWDKDLLESYLADDKVEPDFKDAIALASGQYSEKQTTQRKIDTIRANGNFLALNPYIVPCFERIITEPYNYMRVPRDQLNVTIDEALKVTKAFYNTTDVEVRNAFYRFFNERHAKLMARNPRRNDKTVYKGLTICSEAKKDCLVTFEATMDFEMLSVLIHEYGHAVSFLLRNYHNMYECNSAFCEIESVFMELMAYHWLQRNKHYARDARTGMIMIFNNILDNIKDTIEASELNEMIKDMYFSKRRITMREIIMQAKNEFTGMNQKYIMRLLSKPVERVIRYSYSSLLAIELYEIYLQDPNSAIDLYKRIMHGQKETAIATNKAIKALGINAGEHLTDFTRELKR